MNTTPIAFMAWDKEEKCFILPETLTDQYEHNWLSIINSDSYGFMQLTALRSINDDPIYNHMIVKSKAHHYIVDMFDYGLMHRLSCTDLEIVGNRFQDPELLELCK